MPGSLRFRLTAWYGLLLGLALATLAVSVLALARSRLQADMDARLRKTAADITAAIEAQLEVREVAGGPIRFDAIVPEFGSFASRGLVIQVVDAADRVVRASEYAPPTPMIAAGEAPHSPDPTLTTTPVNGSWRRVVRDPMILRYADGTESYVGAILVGERLDPLEETLASLRQVLVWTSVGGLAFALVGGWLLAGRALRPVDRLTATAATIAARAGDPAALATRLPVPASGDEIARLAATFNEMLDKLEAAFLTQRRFVADASHELRTPLAAIRGNVDVLARQLAATTGPSREDVAAAIGDVQRESARMARLLDDLLLLARADAALPAAAPAAPREPLRPVRLDELARAALRGAAGLASGQRIELRAEPATVLGDPDRLQQLALILLDNALRHTPAGRAVTVETGAERGAARLVVRDEGDGIAPEHLPHLFDRFYRVDDARDRVSGGTGLGLAIARAIARAHGGEISVESRPGQGAAFTVRLPLAARPPAEAAPARRQRGTVSGWSG